MKKYLFTLFLISVSSVVILAQSSNSECPKMSILDPPVTVAPGENMLFSVSTKSELKNNGYRFEWKINKGSIVEGQGTREITVNTSGLSQSTITAFLMIDGLPVNCKNTFIGTGLVQARPPHGDGHLDEFGEIPLFDVFARLDSAFSDLRSDKSSKGFFISYGPREKILEREKWIAYYAGVRKFDVSRITFARGRAESKIRTRIGIVSKDVVPPACENCDTINGRDIDFDAAEMSLRVKKLECPALLSVTDLLPAVPPGENVTFIARVVFGIVNQDIGYIWTVSGGKLLKGQGTPTITVKIKRGVTTNTKVTITGLPKH
ncbi:MAG: hypothetical protein HKN25_12180, partial [Pyrinomonadaceae bacterium]|nr:hypothetical protein [Pyrinomonadaceae bacterium]